VTAATGSKVIFEINFGIVVPIASNDNANIDFINTGRKDF
jgi:hypothetical protein